MLFAFTVQAEENANQTVEQSKEYYESGALQFEYNYLDGKLHGKSKEFYETGELKAELVYKEGKLDSKKEFLKNGKPTYEMSRDKDNKKIEKILEYYQQGELFRERHLVNGRREGLEKEFYRDGTIKAERNYVKGKKEGSARGFHRNGNLQGDWVFENDLPVKATIYYRDGKVWLEHKHFEDGRLNGVSKEYDKNGNVMAKRYYENDKMVKRVRQ